MFLLIHELIGDFDLQKQCALIDLVCGARLLVLARLQKIRAIARAIERHFALLAAALRANAPVNSGAKAFLLADLTNVTTQLRAPGLPVSHYGIPTQDSTTETRRIQRPPAPV